VKIDKRKTKAEKPQHENFTPKRKIQRANQEQLFVL
jgi:hypothetical protein